MAGETPGETAARYGRVLLKVSGEALMGSQPFGIDEAVVAAIADEIRDVHHLGVQVAIVIGGKASSRQAKQRLGRILRKSGNSRATFGCPSVKERGVRGV